MKRRGPWGREGRRVPGGVQGVRGVLGEGVWAEGSREGGGGPGICSGKLFVAFPTVFLRSTLLHGDECFQVLVVHQRHSEVGPRVIYVDCEKVCKDVSVCGGAMRGMDMDVKPRYTRK